MTKSEAKELLRGDFIPNGNQRVDIKRLRFRRTKHHEVLRCCKDLGFDPQSTYFYCGKIADFVAPAGEGEVVALCSEHKPPIELIVD